MSEPVDSHARSDLPATIAPLWGTAGPTTLPPAPSPTPSFGADAGFGEAVTELQQRVATRLSADGTRYAGLAIGAAAASVALLPGQEVGLRIVIAVDGLSYLAAMAMLLVGIRSRGCRERGVQRRRLRFGKGSI